VFRRVSVISGVRSLSLYLVVSWCVSWLVIVICVVIIALVNKSGIQSESIELLVTLPHIRGIRDNI
jgi:hypothetical protein